MEDHTTGVFTAAGPATSFGQFLADTVQVVGEAAELDPVDGTFLTEQGVDGAQLPMWSEGRRSRCWRWAPPAPRPRASRTGRFEEVVRDTSAWARANPDQATREGVGLAPEREQQLINAAESEG